MKMLGLVAHIQETGMRGIRWDEFIQHGDVHIIFQYYVAQVLQWLM